MKILRNALIIRKLWLENVSFEPGRVNVFIGANGSGKTTVLEAIGLLCAAMTDRIDNSSMQRKGIRLSVPGLCKSAFSDLKRKAPTINFDVSWSQNEKNYQYAVNLNVPNESDSARRDMWRYHSEKLTVNNETVWGRSGASRLFAVNKSRKSGHTTLQRIQITKELMDSGYSLSRLWTEGRLGGVPNL